MKRSQHRPAPYLYSFLLAFLLGGGGALYFNNRFGMMANDFLLLAALALYLALIQLFDRFKKHAAVLTIGLLLLITAFVCTGLAAFPLPAAIEGGETIVNWWFLYNPVTGMGYDWGGALLTLTIYVLLAGFAGYLLQKWLASRIFCMLGAAAALVFFTVSGEDVPFFTLVFALAYLVSVLAEIFFCLSSKRQKQLSSAFIALCLFPVSFFTSWAAALLPRGEEPIDWSFAVEIFDAVRSWGSSVFPGLGLSKPDDGSFDLYSLGYSETAEELGGNIAFSDDTALRLTFPKKTPMSSLRLAGSIQDTYTGRGWEMNAEDFTSSFFECELDSIELLYALGRCGYGYDEELPVFIESKPVTITYQDIRTRSAFLPPKTLLYSFAPDERSAPFRSYSYGAFFERPQRNVFYSATFLDINYDYYAFQQLAIDEAGYRYQQDRPVSAWLTGWISRIINSSDGGGGFFVPLDDLEGTLKDRSDWIRQNYTALPESLPERVRELSEELTSGYYTDYEKLWAIERYLRQDYEYTLTPGEVPEGRDFVDYFLFDGRKGYCAHFATAMAVMARCVGIPTRYVQGFSAQCEEWVPGGEVTCLVQNNEGHVWPEAYLEGIGWVPFEPTAMVRDETSSAWQGEQQPGPGVPIQTPQDDPESNNQQTETDAPDAREETFRLSQSDILLICGAAALLVLGTFFLCSILKAQKRRRRYLRSSASEKAYIDFRKVLLLLRICGLPINEGETLSAYAERVDRAVPHSPFTEAVDVYLRLYYNGEEIGAGGLAKIKKAESYYLAEVKRRFGRFRSFFLFRRIERKAEKFRPKGGRS